MARVIQMFNKQAMQFASIHPVKNGMYFHRVKQLQQWATYWDGLHEDKLTSVRKNRIDCSSTFSSIGDAYLYVESLMAHILDANGTLELIIDKNKYCIMKCHDVGYAFDVYHHMNFGAGWIFQGSALRFKDNIFEMLDVLHTHMCDAYWRHPSSNYLKSMQQ